MGQTASSCFRRHRRKLLIVGGVVGSVALLNGYLRRKFAQWEAQKTIEYFEQLKRQSHFDGTIQTCDTAILSFVPKIRVIIYDTINVDPIVEDLKKKPPNKLELWDELKIMVFTQAVAEVYAQCLLVVLLRAQISILGGYIFTDHHHQTSSGGGDAASAATDLDATTEYQQKYLSHLSNFIVSGIKDLTIPVEDAVRKSLRSYRLNHAMKLEHFEQVFRDISNSMSEGSSSVVSNIARYLMLSENRDSNQNENNGYDRFLEKMLNETKDVLECQDFSNVLSASLDQGMAVLMDRVSECYMCLRGSDGTDFLNPHTMAIPLAKVIPTLHTVFVNHKPDEQGSLVRNLLQQEMLKTFSANLYEAFIQEPQ